MSLAYLLLTLLVTVLVLLLLWRTGAARAITVWLLAALLPLLAAMSAALAGQARAARILSDYQPSPQRVLIQTAGQSRVADLSAMEAACLEQALMLHHEVELLTPQESIAVRRESNVRYASAAGKWPSRAVVEALAVKGQLHCPSLKSLKGE